MKYQANKFLPFLAITTAGLTGACSADKLDVPGQRFEIAVAPLQLNGITNAVYNLTVLNADAPPNNVVWNQDGLSSTQYGDGRGALTYIGTCDATRNPHTVELELVSLTDTTRTLTSPEEYANPAPVGTPIRLTNIMCKENADVSVVFNLTLLRAAKQGFFDIAVNFSDVFCSAKLDCKDELLFDGDVRSPTVVFGFACTAGKGDNTYMYLSDLTLTCTDADGQNPVVTTLPTAGLDDGQQGPKGTAVYEWAQYSVKEFLAQEQFDKCAWNFAVGLDTEALAGKKCSLTAVGTAADRALPGGIMPRDGAYPVITWTVDVLTAQGDLCSNNGLNAAGSGVKTDYVLPSTPANAYAPLTAEHICGAQAAIACGTTTAVGAVNVVPAGRSFQVQVAGVTAPTDFVLPEGWVVASECCQANCCTP